MWNSFKRASDLSHEACKLTSSDLLRAFEAFVLRSFECAPSTEDTVCSNVEKSTVAFTK